MADNVPITAGSGTNIATDEVTGTLEHVQLMKLAISTDGSRTLIPADSTNGLDVDVTRVGGQVQVGDGTNPISVDTTPADAEANSVNALQAMARTMLFNGTSWDRARGDTTNGLDVDVTRVSGNVTTVGAAASGSAASGNPVLIAGIDGSTARTMSVAADGNLIVDAMGNVAHGAADADNPVKIGGRARTSVITSVSNDNRSDQITTIQGYLVNFPYALPQSALNGNASATGTGDTAVIAAQGAGITINVTTITVYNSSTTNTFVSIKDGATTRLVIPAPAAGGAMVTLPFPLRLTANTALNFASAAGVTTMYVSAVGFAGI